MARDWNETIQEYMNNGGTHGFAWPDGKVHDTPYEPHLVENITQALEHEHLTQLPHVTQETLDRAYADWLKSYTEWKKVYAAWEAKYGKR